MNGSHAPFLNCEKINDFRNLAKLKFEALHAEQKIWFEREEGLKSYRKEHLDEVNNYFDSLISKFNERLKDEKDQDYKTEILKELNELKQTFVDCVTNDDKQFDKFQKELDSFASHALKNIDARLVDVKDDHLIFCPNCNARIERNAGCIHMTCQQCRIEFCSVCGKFWRDNHKEYYTCPNQIKVLKPPRVIDGINYDDENDKKFYPMPFDVEKQIDFHLWKYCSKMHNYYLQKLERLEETISTFPCFNINNDKQSLKQINDITFAQSVAAWGYPHIYYSFSNETKEFEEKLTELDHQIDEVIRNIEKETQVNSNDYLANGLDDLKNKVKIIFDSVESH
ncbi:hypothetical protein M9Y10_037804 [Tritrichomonas musculus]|uniref:RING-type domain-containing protein n=1 Tax=Tritrichomonas musculus TaxID=1915356 RepID=A0ABR2GRJ5_9EUKA